MTFTELAYVLISVAVKGRPNIDMNSKSREAP